MPEQRLLKVFVDADVLFRAATASHEFTAALVLLRMSEFTLIDAVTAGFTVDEAVRNIERWLPTKRPHLLRLIAHSLRIVDDPTPESLHHYRSQAHWKDVINVAAAMQSNSHVLVTFNIRHYSPVIDGMRVMTPGQMVQESHECIFKMLAS